MGEGEPPPFAFGDPLLGFFFAFVFFMVVVLAFGPCTSREGGARLRKFRKIFPAHRRRAGLRDFGAMNRPAGAHPRYAQPMDVVESRVGEVVVLTPGPEVDIRALPAFEARVDALLASGVRGLVFDLSPVVLLPSTVAGFLVSCAARLRAAGGKFAVAAPSPRVRRTLATLGVDAVLSVRDSLDLAVALVRGG